MSCWPACYSTSTTCSALLPTAASLRCVRSQFSADVASLRRLFLPATFAYPKLRQAGDPVGILSDIEAYTLSERELTTEAFAAFKQKFLELYADLKDRFAAKVSLTRKIMQTIKLGVHSGMTFEKGIFAIIRSLMYLDGMVLRCKPDAVLLRDMRRFIGEFEKLVK